MRRLLTVLTGVLLLVGGCGRAADPIPTTGATSAFNVPTAIAPSASASAKGASADPTKRSGDKCGGSQTILRGKIACGEAGAVAREYANQYQNGRTRGATFQAEIKGWMCGISDPQPGQCDGNLEKSWRGHIFQCRVTVKGTTKSPSRVECSNDKVSFRATEVLAEPL